jgi:hypothetical protein
MEISYFDVLWAAAELERIKGNRSEARQLYRRALESVGVQIESLPTPTAQGRFIPKHHVHVFAGKNEFERN